MSIDTDHQKSSKSHLNSISCTQYQNRTKIYPTTIQLPIFITRKLSDINITQWLHHYSAISSNISSIISLLCVPIIFYRYSCKHRDTELNVISRTRVSLFTWCSMWFLTRKQHKNIRKSFHEQQNCGMLNKTTQ